MEKTNDPATSGFQPFPQPAGMLWGSPAMESVENRLGLSSRWSLAYENLGGFCSHRFGYG